MRAGVAQLARASRCHREGRGFESRFPLQLRHSPNSIISLKALSSEWAKTAYLAFGAQMENPWGSEATEYFFNLTPDAILDAFEKSTGFRATGRAMALGSMENRVYEIEIERDIPATSSADNFIIAKFYRPGRWSLEQILEEHQFLDDLAQAEIPVTPAMPFLDGKTAHSLEVDGKPYLHYAVFKKVGGRSPDELSDADLEQVGRLLGRLHRVGAAKEAKCRIKLDEKIYGLSNLAYLIKSKAIPPDIEGSYRDVVSEICQIAEPLFARAKTQRIHGDCHFGNLLYGREGFFWVDFDDMVQGPPVQDLWLMLPGRDEYARRQLRILLNHYQTMNEFDESTLSLIEPLRALRFVHFSAWIHKRWQDQSFQNAFPHFTSHGYFAEQLSDLKEQLSLIKEGGGYGEGLGYF
jgi:Ser/Thr protein kinase RdoA (MazF antagonist)